MSDYHERMIRLAEEFFSAKNDSDQLAITPGIMEQLRKIHPATLNETTEAGGPVAWVLVIPTTRKVMDDFLARTISERGILERTRPGERYEAIYLCSALVLPEFRRKGLARKLSIGAVKAIMKEHHITALYFWPFSPEGKKLAALVGEACNLPLYRREEA
jgi:GNAT superfamily N-acetyltransferase